MSIGQKLLAACLGIALVASVLLPLWMILAVSVTDESTVSERGYRLIPARISLAAYDYVSRNSGRILRALIVTTAQAVIGAVGSVFFMAMLGYGLWRLGGRSGAWLAGLVFIFYFMDWGLLPNYILNSRYLHLRDSFLVYVLPGLYSSFPVLVMMRYHSTQSASAIESARIDGANELSIFLRIILPLSKPMVAGLVLMSLIWRWNEWFTSMLYVSNERLYTLQYLLERVLRDELFVRSLFRGVPGMASTYGSGRPTATVKFAMCALCVLPALILVRPSIRGMLRGLMPGGEKE